MNEFDPFAHQYSNEAEEPVEQVTDIEPQQAVEESRSDSLVAQQATEEPKTDWNVFDGIARERQSAAENVFRADPEVVRRTKVLSDHFGTSSAFTKDHLEELETKKKTGEFEKLIENAPVFASWLNDNPDIAPLAQLNSESFVALDSLFGGREQNKFAEYGQINEESEKKRTAFEDDMSGIKKDTRTAWDNVTNFSKWGFESGKLHMQRNQIGLDLLDGKREWNEETIAEIDAIDKKLADIHEKHDGLALDAGSVVYLQGPVFYHGAHAGAQMLAAGTTTALVAPVTAPAVISGLPLATLGAIEIEGTRKVELGNNFIDHMKQGIEFNKSAIFAQAESSAVAILETVGDKMMLGTAKPILSKLIPFGKPSQALTELTSKGALKTIAKSNLQTSAVEATTETAQDIVKMASNYLLKLSGEEGVDLPSPSEAVSQLTDTFTSTLAVTAMLGLAPSVVSLSNHLDAVHKAQQSKKFFESMGQLTKSAIGTEPSRPNQDSSAEGVTPNGEVSISNAREPVAPDVVHSFIESEARESGKETTFIDAGEFDEVLHQEGVSREEVRQILAPEKTLEQFNAELDEKIATGADVEIPTADYAVKIAATPLGEKLTNHARLTPEGLSFADAVKLERAFNDMQKAIVKGTFENQDQAERFLDRIETREQREARSAIETTLIEELKEAQPQMTDSKVRTQAKFGALVTSTLAHRAHIPVSKWMEIRPVVKGYTESNPQSDTLHQTLSPAIIGKKAIKNGTGEDSRFVRQWANVDAMRKNPKQLAHNLGTLAQIPGIAGVQAKSEKSVPRVRKPSRRSTEGKTANELKAIEKKQKAKEQKRENAVNEAKLEATLALMKDNLLWIYDHMPESIRNRAHLWYDGGHKSVVEWARRYGIYERQTAAIIAVYSPRNGWFNNFTQAERTLDIYFSEARYVRPTEEMVSNLREILTYEIKDKKTGKKRMFFDEDSFLAVKDKTLDELLQEENLRHAAMWLRAYDYTFNDHKYRVQTPEGGVGDWSKSGKGYSSVTWSSYAPVAKALSILKDGSLENVDFQLGEEFKVRDFYDNLYAPSNPNAATIDTHQVGANTLSVMSSKSEAVKQNFGGSGNSSDTGQRGTYAIYFEALRRAAEERGILPREMQSISWEGVRVLFKDSEKKSLRPKVEAIWSRVDKGEITAEEAREQILEVSGGFSQYAWENTPFNDTPQPSYDRSNVKLLDIESLPLEPTLALEVAPHPENKTAVKTWNTLNRNEKYSVTKELTTWVLERVALLTESRISEPLLQLGGWKGDVNYSISATIADKCDPVLVARILSYILNQEATMVLSGIKNEGMFNAKVLTIEMPEGFTPDQADALYREQIDSLTDENGLRLVDGMSTVGRYMRIVLQGNGRDEAIAKQISQHLENYAPNTFVASLEDAFASFSEPITKEELDAYIARRNGKEGVHADQGIEASIDDLREEAEARLNDAIERAAEARRSQPGTLFQKNVWKPDEELIQRAKDNFGVTQDPKEAFYVLPDGTMLDGSGRHWGADERDIAGQRQVDHQDIGEIIDDSPGGADAMYKWMARSGAMRFDQIVGIASIARPITPQQLAVLGKVSKGKYLALSRNTPEGRIVDDTEFDSASPRKIEDFFNHAQVLADNGVAGAYAQLAYHGTPYEVLAFDTDKIGTGEGAQAHGWGLYFASDRMIAERYRDVLSSRNRSNSLPAQSFMKDVRYEGMTAEDYTEYVEFILSLPDSLEFFEDTTLPNGIYVYNPLWAEENGLTKEELGENALTVDEFLANVAQDVSHMSERTDIISEAEDYKDFLESNYESRYSAETVAWFNREVGDKLKALYEEEKKTAGHVYQVDIPNDDVLLDEQAYFYEMPQPVQDGIRRIFEEYKKKFASNPEAIESFSDYESMTGREIYKVISLLENGLGKQTSGGNPKAASLKLLSEGIQGVTYVGNIDGRCFVVFSNDAIEIVEQYQRELQTHREAIKTANEVAKKYPYRGAYSASENSITLTPNADLSTFSHEMGHWYLQNLLDLSQMDGVSESLKEDANTMLKVFGLDSYEAWRVLSLRDREVLHEKFAFWTEEYLSSGKAPARNLQGLFDRLGAWIRGVYRKYCAFTSDNTHDILSAQFKSLFGEELPPLSDEVRRVLDRMTASENQMTEALSAESLMPLFEEKPEDMSDADWLEIQIAQDDAESEAVTKLYMARAKDEKWVNNARARSLKKIQSAAKKARDAVRGDVELEVNSMPVYAAEDIISKGNRANVTINLKMDPEAVQALGFNVNQMAKLRNKGLLKKGGVSPQDAFENLRVLRIKFPNAKRMLQAILSAPNKEDLIEKITTERCMQKHSKLFDPLEVEKTVTDAIHSEARSRMVATELKYLSGDLKGNRRVYLEAARRVARQAVSKMPIGKVKVKSMVASEARASREAFRAIKEGNRAKAVVAKRKQLVAHEMVRLAFDAEKKLSTLKNIRKSAFVSDKKIGKTRDIDFVNVVRYILTNEGFGSNKIKDDPLFADKFIKKTMKYDADRADMFETIINSHPYRPGVLLNERTVGDLESLLEHVDMFWKLSRSERQIVLDGKSIDRRSVIDELLTSDPKVKHYRAGTHKQTSESQKATFRLLSTFNKLKRVESWCLSMDGGKPGAWFNYVFRPIREAASAFKIVNIKYQKKLADMVGKRKANWESVRDIEFTTSWGYTYTFQTKAELIGALLHCGNQSNKEKLLVGGRGPNEPWARVIDYNGEEVVDTSDWDSFVQDCVDNGFIEKEDMEFVQGVWDLLEETKPMVQKAFKAQYGFYFEEVENAPFKLKFGNEEIEYRGGYVPAKSDLYLNPDSHVNLEKAVDQQNDVLSAMPSHRPGFTHSRSAAYRKPLDLTFTALASHIEGALKYAHLSEPCNEVAKILNDRQIKDFLGDIDPTILKDLLMPWLKRSLEQTTSKVDRENATPGGRLASKLRSLAGMNIMAGHIVNALQQVTGISVAVPKVGARNLFEANAQIVREGMAKTVKMITTASPFMRTRFENRAMEYQSEVKRAVSGSNLKLSQADGKVNKLAALYSTADSARDWCSRHAYFLQSAMQVPIDSVVWVAAYNKAMKEGESHADAVAVADSAIVTTQSDFSPENIANIEAGSPLMKLFLVFYNYFGMQANLLGERWQLAKETKRYGRFATDALFIVWIPAVVSEAITRALLEGFDSDDDDDIDGVDLANLLVGAPIQNVIAMFPILGGVVNSFGSYAAKKDIASAQLIYGSDPYVGKIYSSPGADLAESSIFGIIDIYKAATDEDNEVNYRKITREALDLASVITGLPLGALKKPLGYTAGVMGDQLEEPRNPIELMRGVLSGRGEEQ